MDRLRLDLTSGGSDERTIDEARLVLASSLASGPKSAEEVKAEGFAWKIALTDAETNSPTPAWVIKKAVREYIGGKHGKYFPTVAEFVLVCNRIKSDLRREIWLRERYLNAKVIEAPVVDEAMKARIAELLSRMS